MEFILILNFLLWVKVIQSAADSFHITSEMLVLKMNKEKIIINKLYSKLKVNHDSEWEEQMNLYYRAIEMRCFLCIYKIQITYPWCLIIQNHERKLMLSIHFRLGLYKNCYWPLNQLKYCAVRNGNLKHILKVVTFSQQHVLAIHSFIHLFILLFWCKIINAK